MKSPSRPRVSIDHCIIGLPKTSTSGLGLSEKVCNRLPIPPTGNNMFIFPSLSNMIYILLENLYIFHRYQI